MEWLAALIEAVKQFGRPVWYWLYDHWRGAIISALSLLAVSDAALQMPPYYPSAGWRQLFEKNCGFDPADPGTFSVEDKDYAGAKWAEFDLQPAKYIEPATGNASHSLTVSGELRQANGTYKWPADIAGAVRNTQYPRIQFQIPKHWYSREIVVRMRLRWENARPLDNAYPAVVAVNFKVDHPAWGKTSRYIPLLGEAVPDRGWVTETFLPVRIPAGASDAWLRVGLHGVTGTLYVDDVSFLLCR